MIVRCANCHTEFSLDDHQVGAEGATVRCSVCNYIFRVDPPAGGVLEHPWQIRTIEDLLFTAPDLVTLQQWIEEGRLHPDDQVSRTGKHWLRLGDMPEFSRIFQGFQGLPRMVTAIDERVGSAAHLGPPPNYGGEGPPRPPSSMLDAVTRHVQDGEGPGASHDARDQGRVANLSHASDPTHAPPPWPDSAAHDDDAPLASHTALHGSEGRSRARGWIWGGIGILAGIGVGFGVAPIRAALMGAAGGLVGESRPAVGEREPAEVDAARAALMRLDGAEMAHAEASLQATIDEGGHTPSAVAAMKLAQVEVLSTMAIEEQLLEAVDVARARGGGYLDRATSIFQEIEVSHVIDRAWLKQTRALLRLAQGRSSDEIMALAVGGSPELLLWVRGASLWRDAQASVPPGLIEDLRGLEQPAMLSRLLLGLAYYRSSDGAGVDGVVTRVLHDVPEQRVARALKAAAESTQDVAGIDAVAEIPSSAGERSGAVDPSPAAETGSSARESGEAADPTASSQPTVDQLVERGCAAVENGNSTQGLELLRRAHDRRPGDLDVLVCMAQAHINHGRWSEALALYERALARSPAYRTALAGAARASSQLNHPEKALAYYKRLLDIDPGNQSARKFVAEHDGSATSGAAAPAKSSKSSQPSPFDPLPQAPAPSPAPVADDPAP